MPDSIRIPFFVGTPFYSGALLSTIPGQTSPALSKPFCSRLRPARGYAAANGQPFWHELLRGDHPCKCVLWKQGWQRFMPSKLLPPDFWHHQRGACDFGQWRNCGLHTVGLKFIPGFVKAACQNILMYQIKKSLFSDLCQQIINAFMPIQHCNVHLYVCCYGAHQPLSPCSLQIMLGT